MQAINRRKFLGAGAGGVGLLGLAGAVPAWARGGDLLAGSARKGIDEAAGPNIDLTVARSAFSAGPAIHPTLRPAHGPPSTPDPPSMPSSPAP